MKLIDVLIKLSNGEIKKDTTLTVNIGETTQRQYKYYRNAFLDDYNYPLNIYDENYLNQEVNLVEPKNIKYHLKLDINDDDSYVATSSYDNDFNYDLGGKTEVCEFKTKFTQEEIDNNKFLKFVETHGIKEEVKDDAND